MGSDFRFCAHCCPRGHRSPPAITSHKRPTLPCPEVPSKHETELFSLHLSLTDSKLAEPSMTASIWNDTSCKGKELDRGYTVNTQSKIER